MSDNGGWQYDPGTGNRGGNTGRRRIVRYDSQTGEPIYEDMDSYSSGNAGGRRIVRYDSRTGEPIYEDAGAAGGRNDGRGGSSYYDGTGTSDYDSGSRTGSSSYDRASYSGRGTSGNRMRFDPQTGRPIYDGADSGFSSDGYGNVDRSGGRGRGGAGGGRSGGNGYGSRGGHSSGGRQFPAKLVGIIAVAAAAAVVVIIVLANVVGGHHGTRLVDGAVAAVNSIEDSQLGKDMGLADNKNSKSGSVGVDGSFDASGTSVNMDATFSYDFGSKKYSIDGSVGASGISTDVQLYADSSSIRLSVPVLYDKVFAYDYTKSSDGYFVQLLDDQLGENLSMDQVNSIISYALNDSYDDVTDVWDQLLDDTKSNLNGLKWKRADRQEFTIDGKDVRCSGYSAEFTAADLEDWMNRYEETITDELDRNQALAEIIATAAGLDSGSDVQQQVQDAFDSVKSSLENSDDGTTATLTYYIHGTEPAAILFSGGSESLEVDFEGGDFTLQNIEVKSNGSTVLSTEGETDGSRETWSISADNLDGTYGYVYDSDSGDLTLTMPDSNGYGTITVDGTLQKENNGYSFAFRSSGDSEYNANVTVTYSRKADIQAVSGDAVDLNTATQSDLEGIVSEIQNKLYSLLY